jgi:hypothetical protein
MGKVAAAKGNAASKAAAKQNNELKRLFSEQLAAGGSQMTLALTAGQSEGQLVGAQTTKMRNLLKYKGSDACKKAR